MSNNNCLGGIGSTTLPLVYQDSISSFECWSNLDTEHFEATTDFITRYYYILVSTISNHREVN